MSSGTMQAGLKQEVSCSYSYSKSHGRPQDAGDNKMRTGSFKALGTSRYSATLAAAFEVQQV